MIYFYFSDEKIYLRDDYNFRVQCYGQSLFLFTEHHAIEFSHAYKNYIDVTKIVGWVTRVDQYDNECGVNLFSKFTTCKYTGKIATANDSNGVREVIILGEKNNAYYVLECGSDTIKKINKCYFNLHEAVENHDLNNEKCKNCKNMKEDVDGHYQCNKYIGNCKNCACVDCRDCKKCKKCNGTKHDILLTIELSCDDCNNNINSNDNNININNNINSNNINSNNSDTKQENYAHKNNNLQMYKTKYMYNCIIEYNGEEIKAHKNYLTLKSKYFDILFKTYNTENNILRQE